MKNTIRCCISCILPCGALDVIRIVHSNGRVEEISGTVRACEIMRAYPKHVLKKPSSSNSDPDNLLPNIVIVPPEAQLQRGKIYFLMPLPNSSSRNKKNKKKKSEAQIAASNMTNLLVSDDQYLSEILSENLSSHGDPRRGRVAVWRPRLESICESPNYDL